MTMMSRTLITGTVAVMLAACQGQSPPGNGQASQAEQVEQANLPAVPKANQASQTVNQAVPAPVAEQSKSCEAEIGKQAADELVRRCLNVSPATHPPCNAANSCEMIQQEIDRSCAMFDDDKPSDCRIPEAL